MIRKLFFHLLLAGIVISLVPPGFALEKVKLGTPTKLGVTAYLPVLAGEQKGFWKENGLEVEWVPLAGAAPLMRAAAAGILNVALVASETPMTAAERGVPVIMVGEYVSEYPLYVWVRNDSPYRHPRDLKGAKIGIDSLWGTTHAYARVMTKANGLEKDVRYVGTGGIPQTVAGLRVGLFDVSVYPLSSFVRLKLQGIVREIGSMTDYLPKPWVHYTISARKDFARSQPDVARKVIRGTLQATDFMRKNPRWTMDLMKSFQGLSEEEAKQVYDVIQFSITGKIDRQGVENARRFYMEYGILTDKAPAVDELFTNDFLP